MTASDDWIARDAAVVAWLHPDEGLRRQPPRHRRTGRGPRGHRRRTAAALLDAISSVWVTTLGDHHLELDAARAAPRPRGPHHHAARQQRRDRALPRISPAHPSPVDDPHFPLARPTGRRRSRRSRCAFQFPWANTGVRGRMVLPRVWRPVPTTATIGSLSLGGWLRHRPVRPVVLPGAAHLRSTIQPGFRDRAAARCWSRCTLPGAGCGRVEPLAGRTPECWIAETAP